MKFISKKKDRKLWTTVRTLGKNLRKRMRQVPSPVKVAMVYLLAVMVMTSIFLWRAARYYPDTSFKGPDENIHDVTGGEEDKKEPAPVGESDPALKPVNGDSEKEEETAPLPGPAVWPVSLNERKILTRFDDHITYYTPYGQEGHRWHLGIDIAAPEGTPVVAVWEGKVLHVAVFFGVSSIKIEHGGNYITFYENLSEILVKPGDRVKQGQLIGKVGNAAVRDRGLSVSYLYFEVKANGDYGDPLKYLP